MSDTASCNYCGKLFVDLDDLITFHEANNCPNAATCTLPTAGNPVEQGGVVTSPDGARHKPIVANDGTLSTESA